MVDPQQNAYEQFVRLLSSNEGRLKAFLRTLLPRWEDVEEAAQETSLVAWKKFAQFEKGSDFSAWLLTIGRFEALKLRRTLFKDRLVFREELWDMMLEEGTAESQSLQDQRQALDCCLQKLTPEQREWLVAAYQPGAKMHEVAQNSGRSSEAFYKIIQRLRSLLLDCIQRQIATEAQA
ncbi:MAG: sigma-70 family RNA polymerase sigma factor [Verrucomicrobiota bacterium]